MGWATNIGCSGLWCFSPRVLFLVFQEERRELLERDGELCHPIASQGWKVYPGIVAGRAANEVACVPPVRKPLYPPPAPPDPAEPLSPRQDVMNTSPTHEGEPDHRSAEVAVESSKSEQLETTTGKENSPETEGFAFDSPFNSMSRPGLMMSGSGSLFHVAGSTQTHKTPVSDPHQQNANPERSQLSLDFKPEAVSLLRNKERAKGSQIPRPPGQSDGLEAPRIPKSSNLPHIGSLSLEGSSIDGDSVLSGQQPLQVTMGPTGVVVSRIPRLPARISGGFSSRRDRLATPVESEARCEDLGGHPRLDTGVRPWIQPLNTRIPRAPDEQISSPRSSSRQVDVVHEVTESGKMTSAKIPIIRTPQSPQSARSQGSPASSRRSSSGSEEICGSPDSVFGLKLAQTSVAQQVPHNRDPSPVLAVPVADEVERRQVQGKQDLQKKWAGFKMRVPSQSQVEVALLFLLAVLVGLCAFQASR